MSRTIRFNVPYLTGRELNYVEQAIGSGFFGGNGDFTKRGQQLLEERYGVQHVLLTHSCTAALEMAALLLDLAPGDEVIVPSYTFATTASAFLRGGARLVFAEIDPATMNIDVADVESKVSDRTRAIVPVHYGGIGADMDELGELARAAGALLIEDAAQGLEARYGERWLGTIAPLGAISFHETKNIHAGLAGALFINDPTLFRRAEDMWERGTNRTKMLRGVVDKYTWTEIGSNFYPSELQAAFLLAQLESIEENVAERRPIYEAYDRLLRPRCGSLPIKVPSIPSNRTLNAHSYFIVGDMFDHTERIRLHLLERGVSAYIGYVPLHSSPMGQRLGYKPEDLPITEDYAKRVLRLPLHNSMTVEDVEYVCAAIEEVFA